MKILNDYQNNIRSPLQFNTTKYNLKKKLFENILKLLKLYSQFLINLSENYFKKVAKKNQKYNFLHIMPNKMACLILDEKVKKNTSYTNANYNTTFINYLY